MNTENINTSRTDITGQLNTLQYNTIQYNSIIQYNTAATQNIRYQHGRQNLWLLMLAMSHPRKLVSVLYKKRKFAQKNTQTRNVSKSEVHSIPLWILSGYTRELANFTVLH